MTASNKKRYSNHMEYNQQPKRTAMIQAATPNTFGFDCVNLIKGILWGWTGDKSKTYGGAKYKANGVPDVNADGMFKLCKDISTDFSKIEIGEALWCKGHIGVYVGDGLAVECTPAWKNNVQMTAVKNVGEKSGYQARKWTKHGKLPWIELDVVQISTPKPADPKPVTSSGETKLEAAHRFDDTMTGKYKVIAPVSMHIRAGAGQDKKSLGILKKDEVVHNYGYYSVASNNAKWLYVKTAKGITGFCSSRYLKKC